jgi:hypothetical protein
MTGPEQAISSAAPAEPHWARRRCRVTGEKGRRLRAMKAVRGK